MVTPSVRATTSLRERETIAQVVERPYQVSYFLPSRIEGKPVEFVVDAGCTTNMLSKTDRIKGLLEESQPDGLMADDTPLPFYGFVKLPFQVGDRGGVRG